MSPRRLKIAYLCDHSPLDRNLYSGGNARIYQALRRHVGDVTILPAGWGLAEPLRRLLHASPEAINLRARWRLHLALGRVIAREVHRALRRDRFDVLFTAYSFQSLAGVRPPYPLLRVFTADATPTGYKRSEVGQRFGSFLPAARLIDPLILRAERRIFRAQDLLLWPAEWQRQVARDLYALDDDRSVVVPWGANIDDPGPPGPVPLAPDGPLRLLFVGRDWFAKGGPLVLELARQLRARGVDARLAVVGTTPPADPAPWLDIHPSLDKADPAQNATFQALLSQAHFMVMASFESWGFAFCEASAHGLPSLALRTGGVPVRDGINGHALPPGASAEDFAAIIHSYLDAPPRYAALRQSARREYETRLNWNSWARRAGALMHAQLDRMARGAAPDPKVFEPS